MSDIARRLEAVRQSLPGHVRLVAVSKFHPASAIAEAYNAGQRLFGESRVQELLEKEPVLPGDIHWHFIGHLQTNKVKALVGHADMIESVDSDRLLRIIDDCSQRAGVVSRVLMQVHVAQEETKFGFSPDELYGWFAAGGYRTLKATHICGLMAMASNTDDQARVAADFQQVARLMERIRHDFGELEGFDTLSMGMSHDYPLAIAAGANLVRVGSMIFGEREY